ncbi:hypothetical protein SISNIDRAFT_459488 [Sistotremastrum niveocremeum HHB9708]|uniref:Arrestin-like N-terminal domain-containing protein n=1 Tax=Sistotremastrum niveocremeum HHB9708 TaxID=1314777 RepID=A0A164PEQ4_9AGAM|nr:hypothetical protein SISNIDRAFT_459488 [Sistotremastrum niveocremeum HHB9708]
MPFPLFKSIVTAKNGQIVVLDYSPFLATPGSSISGVVRVDTELAKKSGLKEVTVELVGELRLGIDTAGGQTPHICQKKNLFEGDNLKISVWNNTTEIRHNDLPERSKLDKESSPPSFQAAIAESSGLIAFPFSFQFPHDASLLPSFTDNLFVTYAEGIVSSVQYFVQVKGLRNEIPSHDSNITLVKPFVYLPFDHSPPPPVHGVTMRTWKGGSNPTKAAMFGEKKVGEVQVHLSVPNLPSFPLSQQIPTSIRVICFSPYMSSSNSTDHTSFKFPLPPTKPQDLDLKLSRRVDAMAWKRKHRMHRKIDLGFIAGFGRSSTESAGGGTESLVHVEVGEPVWILREDNKKEGRWRQEVSFHSVMVFNCSPTFEHENLSIRYILDLKIPFPGIGNDLELSATLPPITSGIIAEIPALDGIEKKLDLHHSYFEKVPIEGYPVDWK